MTHKAFLLILDGWGIGQKPEADAIFQANTPYFDSLWANYPHSTLVTHGEEVGLPDGQMGNSEVGHLNIGAGRIIWQELARINKAVRERELHQNETLLKALRYAKTNGKTVHYMGLVSNGGVHSHIEHLKAMCDIATEQGCPKVLIHAFTDGRDCDPKSGIVFIENLLQHIENQPYSAHPSAGSTNAKASSGKPIELATVIGRYYAMDRDKRWERVKLAYDLLVNGVGEEVEDFPTAIRKSYEEGVSDEFLKPMRRTLDRRHWTLDKDNVVENPPSTIQPGDVVVCFNFRTDRCREITEVLTQQDIPDFGMKTLPLYYVTMTRYDHDFKNVHVMFEKDDVRMTLGEVLERAGKTQVRIAETEKYPHVTFFFSGGREDPFVGERRIMIPSAKVATYDLQPEMSAEGITQAIMADIQFNAPDFICLNFANTDMVGHTGVFSAAMKAAETVDGCLSRIIPLALEYGYACVIIADHGNSDYLINEDGTPNTAHTKNPVPCILVSPYLKGSEQLKDGRLADIAPTLLDLMGIPKGAEMTGRNLVSRLVF
ncbi:MAG: 2,3-bisphosphoglycerate-independent phosphoglycerate mutase [Saprospiraceae bacterium]|nr:2,3-bisphosphoglycerate-independent phosphoglycerate mutase [Saprospiraceae bacterium]